MTHTKTENDHVNARDDGFAGLRLAKVVCQNRAIGRDLHSNMWKELANAAQNHEHAYSEVDYATIG